MSKKTLNLTVEESIKQRAKRIARQRGISVSRLFEEAVAREEDTEEFVPIPGSAVEQLMNAIPKADKLQNYDYKKIKMDALKDKYGI